MLRRIWADERSAYGVADRGRYRWDITDVALIDEETGRISIAKVPTTTHDFAEGVIAGLQQGLMRYGLEPAAVSLLSHATTVVTNTSILASAAAAE